jgi:predicted hydrocarbon binding protein
MTTDHGKTSSPGPDSLPGDGGFLLDAPAGVLRNPQGARMVGAGPEFIRSLYLILSREPPDIWRKTLQSAGLAWGRKMAADLDASLAAAGSPGLSELPLEACMQVLEQYFARHGLGKLALDLTFAPEHGLVVARLENALLVEVLAQATHFTDPLPAGLLQGFFQHLSGQPLGCAEIACGRQRAPQCTFVITDSGRLSAVMPHVGTESAEAIIARLRA